MCALFKHFFFFFFLTTNILLSANNLRGAVTKPGRQPRGLTIKLGADVCGSINKQVQDSPFNCGITKDLGRSANPSPLLIPGPWLTSTDCGAFLKKTSKEIPPCPLVAPGASRLRAPCGGSPCCALRVDEQHPSLPSTQGPQSLD